MTTGLLLLAMLGVAAGAAGCAGAGAGRTGASPAGSDASAGASAPREAQTRPSAQPVEQPTTSPIATTAPAEAGGGTGGGGGGGGGEMSLFDGKTLGHWKPINYAGAGDPAVENGKLMIPVGERLTGVAWEGPELPKTNYEITLRAKRVDGSDFFCGLTFPIGESHATLILGGWGGALCGLSNVNGDDAAHNPYKSYRTFEDNWWYNIRVRVTPAKVEAWVDQDKVLDIDAAGKTFSVRGDIEESKPLGLATFQTTGAFKHIRLKELNDDNNK